MKTMMIMVTIIIMMMTMTLFQMLPTNRPIGLNPDGVRVSRLQNHHLHYHHNHDHDIQHLHHSFHDNDDENKGDWSERVGKDRRQGEASA